jgi:hypothetical protein
MATFPLFCGAWSAETDTGLAELQARQMKATIVNRYIETFGFLMIFIS